MQIIPFKISISFVHFQCLFYLHIKIGPFKAREFYQTNFSRNYWFEMKIIDLSPESLTERDSIGEEFMDS